MTRRKCSSVSRHSRSSRPKYLPRCRSPRWSIRDTSAFRTRLVAYSPTETLSRCSSSVARKRASVRGDLHCVPIGRRSHTTTTTTTTEHKSRLVWIRNEQALSWAIRSKVCDTTGTVRVPSWRPTSSMIPPMPSSSSLLYRQTARRFRLCISTMHASTTRQFICNAVPADKAHYKISTAPFFLDCSQSKRIQLIDRSTSYGRSYT
jgi:hypothetical protein